MVLCYTDEIQVYLVTYYKFSSSWGFWTKVVLSLVKLRTFSNYFNSEIIIKTNNLDLKNSNYKKAPKPVPIETKRKYIRITANTEKGVLIEEPNYIDWKYIYEYADVIELQYTPNPSSYLEDIRLKRVFAFLTKVKGLEYDYLGIVFSQFIKAKIDDKDKYFCSEISAELLKRIGFDLDEPYTYSPSSLYEVFRKEEKEEK
jgi:hypothetical protein